MRAVAAAMLVVASLAACSSGEDASASDATPTASASPTDMPTARMTPSPTPISSPSSSPAASGTYLALGDSLAGGVGATRPDETGYVARLYRALSVPGRDPQATVLHNLAVGGETSTSMIRDGQLVEAVGAIARADPPIVLVTIDIGGNDLLRLLGTDACALEPLGPDCLQLLALTLEDFEANYRQIIGELMSALDASAPAARLAVMTYFNPFSGTDASHEAAGEIALLGADHRLDCEADDPQARGMNDIITCAGEALGAVPVDIQPAFAGLGLELTHIASDDIHANDRGYDVIADAFLGALERAAT